MVLPFECDLMVVLHSCSGGSREKIIQSRVEGEMTLHLFANPKQDGRDRLEQDALEPLVNPVS